jgi:hypothetical protein
MKGNSMKPEALHKIAETLQKSHHQHLGITRQPPKPPHAPPASRLERHDLLAFTNALDNARDQWPDSDLCLIGADGALASTNIDDPTDTLPPGFLQFLDPEMLMRIPIGDPEDQEDQID